MNACVRLLLQLTLNAAWTLAVIAMLGLAILLTLLAFVQVSRSAAWLLVPYLAWVTFATVLNFTLWRLNPG